MWPAFLLCFQEDGSDCIAVANFTMEVFMEIYSKVVNQREDIQSIITR